jgi:hypothetical protein
MMRKLFFFVLCAVCVVGCSPDEVTVEVNYPELEAAFDDLDDCLSDVKTMLLEGKRSDGSWYVNADDVYRRLYFVRSAASNVWVELQELDAPMSTILAADDLLESCIDLYDSFPTLGYNNTLAWVEELIYDKSVLYSKPWHK